MPTVPFTKENAREMQLRAAKAKHENTVRRRTFRQALEQIMRRSYGKHKNENGELELIDGRMAMMAKLAGKALNDGDLLAMRMVMEVLGEGPAQKLDVTTDGEQISNPLLGVSFTKLQKMYKDAVKREKNETRTTKRQRANKEL